MVLDFGALAAVRSVRVWGFMSSKFEGIVSVDVLERYKDLFTSNSGLDLRRNRLTIVNRDAVRKVD